MRKIARFIQDVRVKLILWFARKNNSVRNCADCVFVLHNRYRSDIDEKSDIGTNQSGLYRCTMLNHRVVQQRNAYKRLNGSMDLEVATVCSCFLKDKSARA